LDSAATLEEARRVAALKSLGLMESGPEERFERITRAAADLFGVPVAAVNLLDDRFLYTKSPQVPGTTVRHRPDTFCDVTISEDRLTVAPDTTADPRFASKPDVAGGRGVRFYAGRPLHVDGHPVGTLCLYDARPRDLHDADLERLDRMGAWAERELLDSREADRAAAIQQALLPTDDPAAPLCAVAGLSLPLAGVGGDFYSWHRIGDTLELALADVMGKSVGSALMAATVRSALNCLPQGTPSQRLQAAAEALRGDLEATGVFATVFLAQLDLSTGALTYTDAGHGLTLILRADGTREQLQGHGLPLGLELGLERRDQHAVLAPGDTLVSFTDGLLDLYGGTQGALDRIGQEAASAGSLSELLELIQRAAVQTAPEDDISAIALARPVRRPV
jgi:hypothetical protein